MEEVRAKAVHRLEKAVGNDAPTLPKQLERAIWNAILKTFPVSERYWSNPKFRYRYTNKVLGIAFNLTNPKNPGLRERVLAGQIAPKRLVHMTPYDMFPELWDPVFDQIAHKQLRKQLTWDVESAPEGLLQCTACKSRKTTYTQLQTRSSDEPMTTFALCLNCGKRWKQ